jgi:hypothetical protein
MHKTVMSVGIALFVAVGSVASMGQTPRGAAANAADRFEVTSLKAVRPTLVRTVDALKKKDVAGAKAAFEDYDSAWNGVEVYINTRSRETYDELERNLQAKITEGLKAPSPDLGTLTSQAQTMLAKYDDAIKMVEEGTPLNPLFDDVARLRIVRASLREVNPALKAGNLAKARNSFKTFDDKWDSIEDLIKARSRESYDAIEKGMVDIERALMPAMPDVDAVTRLVSAVMDKYNAIVNDITKEARSRA